MTLGRSNLDPSSFTLKVHVDLSIGGGSWWGANNWESDFYIVEYAPTLSNSGHVAEGKRYPTLSQNFVLHTPSINSIRFTNFKANDGKLSLFHVISSTEVCTDRRFGWSCGGIGASNGHCFGRHHLLSATFIWERSSKNSTSLWRKQPSSTLTKKVNRDTKDLVS